MTLPKGWKQEKLGDLLDAQRGISWEKSQENNAPVSGSIPVVGISNVQENLDLSDLKYLTGISEKKVNGCLAKKGWSLMVGSNGNADRVGNCVYIDRDQSFLFASFLLGMSVKNKSFFNEKYAFYILCSKPIQEAITNSVSGSTGLKNISLKMLRSEKVIVPSLPEQEKIAEILGSVDAAIEATQHVIYQTAKTKKALMTELLTRGLPNLHTRFKPSSFGEIPKDWEMRQLGSLFQVVERPIKMLDDKEYRLVTVKRRNGGVVAREQLNGEQIKVKSQFEVREGDFLISKRQIVHGACEIVPKSLSGAIVSNEYSVLAAKDDIYLPYFRWIVRSKFMYHYFLISSVGVHIEKMLFRLDQWFKLEMPTPPLEEQKKITEILESVETSAAENQKKLEQLKYLKSALMQVLLTGKVRVPIYNDTHGQDKEVVNG